MKKVFKIGVLTLWLIFMIGFSAGAAETDLYEMEYTGFAIEIPQQLTVITDDLPADHINYVIWGETKEEVEENCRQQGIDEYLLGIDPESGFVMRIFFGETEDTDFRFLTDFELLSYKETLESSILPIGYGKKYEIYSPGSITFVKDIFYVSEWDQNWIIYNTVYEGRWIYGEMGGADYTGKELEDFSESIIDSIRTMNKQEHPAQAEDLSEWDQMFLPSKIVRGFLICFACIFLPAVIYRCKRKKPLNKEQRKQYVQRNGAIMAIGCIVLGRMFKNPWLIVFGCGFVLLSYYVLSAGYLSEDDNESI